MADLNLARVLRERDDGTRLLGRRLVKTRGHKRILVQICLRRYHFSRRLCHLILPAMTEYDAQFFLTSYE